MQLLKIMKEIDDILSEIYPTEDIIAIVPASDERKIRMFSVLTQHCERPKFTAWLWDNDKKELTQTNESDDINLSVCHWMSNTSFIKTLHEKTVETHPNKEK